MSLSNSQHDEDLGNTHSSALLIEPDVYADSRGFFMETWNQQKYSELYFPDKFVQDNLSFSKRGLLRGLDFQNPQPQGKLVTVLHGEVFDVAVDLRANSRTFGTWFGARLSSDNNKQIFIPEGVADGFLVTSDEALFFYKCVGYYKPELEETLLWNDSDIVVEWPLGNPPCL